jgi:NADH-quinone oxidoreductase subunit M
MFDLLVLILIINIITIIIVLITPLYYHNFLKIISLISSFFLFLLMLKVWFNFDKLTDNFQYVNHFKWSEHLNIYYSIGIDGFSILFLVLTTFLIPFCILYSWNNFIYSIKELLILLLSIEFLLINFFIVLDLVFFYIFFESILLPMFILIGCFGSRQRRIHASFQFFLFTLTGSFFMLMGIFIVYLHEGSTDFLVLNYSAFNKNFQLILWVLFFIALAVKIPLFPIHIWLPEAHVEAPTVGSVILAGVLLKMGTYGVLRFILPVFPFASKYFAPLVIIISFMAIVYISMVTFCQIDLKKLIAYSSVAHMGYVTIGLFTYDLEGLQGSIFLMVSHGIVSSLLFFLIGMLYDRYKTRIVYYYQTLITFMPIFSFFCFIALLANIGFPGTISFIGEFLILLSVFPFSKFMVFYNSFGLIISAIYSFWLYNRIFFGPYTTKILFFSDISRREFFVLFPFIICIFLFGLFPSILLNTTEFCSLSIIVKCYS